MSIALLVYLTSLFLPSIKLSVIAILFFMTLLSYYNQNPYKYLLVCTIMLVSSFQPFLSDDVTGLVVSQDDNLYRILTPTHTISVVTDQNLELDTIVRVKGEYKINAKSNKKRYQTFYYPLVESKAKLPSFRRKVWNNLKDRKKLQTIVFSKYDENESLLASQGWYLLGLLQILKWCFKPMIGSNGVIRQRRILTSIYFITMSQSISTFRLFIGSFLKVEMQIILILCLYPKLNSSAFFYLVYGPFLFSNLHMGLKKNIKFLRPMIISCFLNKLNLAELVLMPVLKIYAGFQFVFAIAAIFLPQIPFESELVESVFMKIKSIPIEITGHISFLSILVFGILVIKKRSLGMYWFVFVYSFVIINPITTFTFINVGQGDATLIKKSFNQDVVLIDTGKPSAYSSLKRELLRKGVKSIDTLVITHDDLDHSGNYESVISDFNVKRTISEKKEELKGFSFFLEDINFENKNDNSLILKSEFNVIFTGDAGTLQEFLLSKDLNSNSKILKLGHHGSKTSSSKKYLLHHKPSIAIISSDPSAYGHPHQEVLKNLYDSRIPYLETSKEGSITFYFVGKVVFFLTENGRLGFV